ncbi:MAG: hypothetical protein R2681_13595 [Pyrinomonadaceae bacterium]
MEHGVEDEEALAAVMAEKTKKSTEKGSDIYQEISRKRANENH